MKFIGFQADGQLASAIDKARLRKRMDKSLWVRRAIANQLKEEGVSVPDEWIFPPPRGVSEDDVALLAEKGTGYKTSKKKKP